MGTIKLTKKEEEWIKDLKKLMRKRPKNLILFADGDLNILKGSKENPSCETKYGRGSISTDCCRPKRSRTFILDSLRRTTI